MFLLRNPICLLRKKTQTNNYYNVWYLYYAVRYSLCDIKLHKSTTVTALCSNDTTADRTRGSHPLIPAILGGSCSAFLPHVGGAHGCFCCEFSLAERGKCWKPQPPTFVRAPGRCFPALPAHPSSLRGSTAKEEPAPCRPSSVPGKGRPGPAAAGRATPEPRR